VDVVALLEQLEPNVIDDAWGAVQRAHTVHYEDAGEQLTRQRLTDLYDLVVTAIRDRDLTPVTAYADSVARERFEAGFGISEVQTAFNSLEEATWRRLLVAHPAADVVEAIGLLSTVLGAGKDELARTYVSLAARRHVPSLDLSAMFRGTNS